MKKSPAGSGRRDGEKVGMCRSRNEANVSFHTAPIIDSRGWVGGQCMWVEGGGLVDSAVAD